MCDELYLKLQNHQKMSDDECFEIASEISQCLNTYDKTVNQKGRNLLIRILDNWINLSEVHKPIFVDLISAAGFYPYLKNFDVGLQDFGEEIRKEFHKSLNLNSKYFHSEQKKISDLIKKHVNVIVSAPTSFGKSMLIEEIVASCEYRNVVIIQPTLALLDETRRKPKKYADNYRIIVKTSQEISAEKGNIFLLTAERVLEYPNMPEVNILILDEFYKLSNKRGDNRSNILNTAFVRIMKNPKCKFYMLGPNIDSIPDGFVEKYDAVFYKTEYSMVLTESENLYNSVHIKQGGKVTEEDIFNVLDNLREQTLIYCSSPKAARKLAFLYCTHLKAKLGESKKQLPLIEWINDNISFRWSLAKCLQYGIAVHDGAMPKHITASTIQYFNNKDITFLFCTNTIIEGVNTSAKNVIYYDNTIGNRKVDYFDYSNIKGRAGRLMEHYVGRIINLRQPPVEEKINVDFPFFDQNPIASEILVNLDKDEIKDINDNVQRYQLFKNKDEELQSLLIRNAVTIDGQEAILKRIFEDLAIPSKRKLIIWNKIDANLYERLQYIFDLCWEKLSTPGECKSYGSKGWVVNKIVSSCYRTSINEMIERDLEYRAKKLAESKKIAYISLNNMFKQFPEEMQERTDNIIEMIFAFQKNWLQYRAPKWINVIDSLQKYATSKLNLPSGDYSYVAEMIESEFIQSNFRILLEYGVPRSAIQKIQTVFEINRIDTKKLTEDDLINTIIEHNELLSRYLSLYEMEILNRVL